MTKKSGAKAAQPLLPNKDTIRTKRTAGNSSGRFFWEIKLRERITYHSGFLILEGQPE